MRVVSLVPSSTETLLALGADVVACTRFCEQPQLRHVGGTKNPDLASIVDLAPDLVVLDRQENRRDDALALGDAGLELFVSDVDTLQGGVDVVAQLAARIGAEPPVLDLPPPHAGARRTAFVPIWRRPWMAIGSATYGGSLLAHLGVDLWAGPTGDPYPEIDPTQLAAAAIDVVLVPSEPYAFTDDHLAELEAAVAGVAVRRVDGRDLFWWGIRTPAALARLAGELDDGRVGHVGGAF